MLTNVSIVISVGLWLITTVITFVHALHYKEMRQKQPCLTDICTFIFLGISYISTSVLINYITPYMSPNQPFFSTNTALYAQEMISCVIVNVPDMAREFNAIQTCLDTVDIYSVRNGRVPYLHTTPSAFVYRTDNSSVFVTSHFKSESETHKALIMIHECAHIALSADDYAYIWEDKYATLTAEEHSNNADSFMATVVEHCFV